LVHRRERGVAGHDTRYSWNAELADEVTEAGVVVHEQDSGLARSDHSEGVGLDHDEITIRLTTTERLLSWRRDLCLPASSVRTVEVIDDPMTTIRGLTPKYWKLLGAYVPGWVAVGTFFDGSLHRRRFVAVHAKQARGLRIDLTDDAPCTQIIISLDDPETTETRLERHRA
jgi:hypothetical protein